MGNNNLKDDWVDVPLAQNDDWADVPPVSADQEKVSKFDAFLRGLRQGGSFGFADELSGALEGSLSGGLKRAGSYLTGADTSKDVDVAKYEAARNLSREEDVAAKEAHPWMFGTGEVAGGVGTAFIPGVGLAANAGKAKMLGNILGTAATYGAGASQAKTGKELATDIGTTAAVGGALGIAAPVAVYLGKKFAQRVPKLAERLAESATGATATQAEKFAPGSGRRLLEEKIVTFGASPDEIAQKAGQFKNEAWQNVDSLLKELSNKGGTISDTEIASKLDQRVMDMLRRGKRQEARALQSEKDEILNHIKGLDLEGKPISGLERSAGGDVTAAPLQDVEILKREYGRPGSMWVKEYQKPGGAEAQRAAYRTLAESVEEGAEKVSPELAAKFKEAKKAYGFVKPIEEAAARRALQLRMSPAGGLLDIATIGAGTAASGSVTKGMVAASARRLVSPRLKSATAVGLDRLSKVLKETPEWLGEFAAPLQKAATRGPQALAIDNYILSQRSQEYRELLKKLSNGEQSD